MELTIYSGNVLSCLAPGNTEPDKYALAPSEPTKALTCSSPACNWVNLDVVDDYMWCLCPLELSSQIPRTQVQEDMPRGWRECMRQCVPKIGGPSVTTRDVRSSCSNCKTTATQLDLITVATQLHTTASSSCCQLVKIWSVATSCLPNLQLQLVATGWVAVAVGRNEEFSQLVAVAVVDFQVKKLDPTGPHISNWCQVKDCNIWPVIKSVVVHGELHGAV